MIHSYSTLTIIISRFSKEEIFRLFIVLHSLGFKRLDENYEYHSRARLRWGDVSYEIILKIHLSNLSSSFGRLQKDTTDKNIEKGRYNTIESYEKFVNLLPEITKVVTECVWTE